MRSASSSPLTLSTMIITNSSPGLPPLPGIHGDDANDLILDIYTHPSLFSHNASPDELKPGYGNTQRLAELGVQVLRLAATQYYFSYHPLLKANELVTKTLEMTSGAKVHEWLNAYELKGKFSLPLEISPMHVHADTAEMERYFYTIVGALTYCNNAAVVVAWAISLFSLADGVKIEDGDATMAEAPPPGYPAPPLPGYSNAGSNQGQSPPSPAHSDGRSAPGGGSQEPMPSIMNVISVAYVNEMASKKKVSIDYHQEKTGQDHNPSWTVRCVIDGEERGRGTATKAKSAKEEAARRAFFAMGWM